MTVVLALAAFVGGPLAAAPAPADAAPKAAKREGPKLDRANQGRLDDLVRFLQDTQNDDGGYGGSPGAASDPLISAWVGIGLAAAGINPQDQKPAGDKGRSVATYLEHHGPARRGGQAPVTTEFERIGMFVNAAGLNPRSFGGRDYVQLLLARQQTSAWDPATSPAGSTSGAADGMPPVGGQNGTGNRPAPAQVVPAGWFPHVAGGRAPGVNDTIFAVFFLAGVGDPALAGPIARAATAIEAMQRPDGTWPAVRPGDGRNTDMTGAAVQALCAARRCGGTAVRSALRWLRANQQLDGGWMSGDMPDERQGESNSGTTPWVVQALWSAGRDPRRWKRPGGRDPLSFLAALQRREGSIRWRQTRDLNPTWMTAYSAPAFAGHPWPVPAPPRAAVVREEARRDAREQREKRERKARKLVRDDAARGDAGEVASGGGATTGGGGGRGADLFSRPQPQSQGATTGGVRDTRKRQERQRGTRGDRGATGTAAASGVGSDGGVQNGEKRRTPQSGTLPQGEVTGQVVQQPRGTEGTEQQQAIAPGLRSAKAGGTTPPWATIGVGTMFLLCVLVGAGVERRRTRFVL